MKGIIIGGGIAGLTAAIALQQRGIEVKVMEAAPELQPVGAGIVMATNAMQVLQRLGLEEKISANGYELINGHVADPRWRTISKMDMDYGKKNYGIGSFAIHRGALQKVLLEQLPEDRVVVNRKVDSITQDTGKVTVKFSNGSLEEADFALGADGIKSVVRQSLFGPTRYRYSGQTCWRAAVEIQVPEKLVRGTYELWGYKAGLRFGLVGIGQNLVYFFATVCAPAGGSDNKQTLKEDLLKLFDTYDELPKSLIQSADVNKIIRTDIYDFAPIPQWHKGRVALIGDAAHATTPNLGQGGCQAVEDAYVVAKMLAQHQEPSKAFEAFQSIRFKKANYVVKSSWQFGQMTNLSPSWLIRLRNSALRMVPTSAGSKLLDTLYTLNY